MEIIKEVRYASASVSLNNLQQEQTGSKELIRQIKGLGRRLFGTETSAHKSEPEPVRDLSPQGPAADRVITIDDLLYVSGRPSALEIPMFPEQLRKDEKPERRIEFAAATVADRVVLAALVKRCAPKSLFEIGTFRGVTAITLASNAPSDAILYTLDLPPDLDSAEVADRFYAYNSSSGFHQMAAAGAVRGVGELIGWYDDVCKIEQLYGDVEVFDFSRFENSIDFFFVDGCHEQSSSLRDTRLAWKCVRPGGMIVWHDYPWTSVQDAIREADLGSEVTWVEGTNVAFCKKSLQ